MPTKWPAISRPMMSRNLDARRLAIPAVISGVALAAHLLLRPYGDVSAPEMVSAVRNHPLALATFGIGLVLLAVTGLCVALGWSRLEHPKSWAAWPLGVAIALIMAQFYLPPVGRMTFGLLFLAAALLFAAVAGSRRR